jgi:hypothetical protein
MVKQRSQGAETMSDLHESDSVLPWLRHQLAKELDGLLSGVSPPEDVLAAIERMIDHKIAKSKEPKP